MVTFNFLSFAPYIVTALPIIATAIVVALSRSWMRQRSIYLYEQERAITIAVAKVEIAITIEKTIEKRSHESISKIYTKEAIVKYEEQMSNIAVTILGKYQFDSALKIIFQIQYTTLIVASVWVYIIDILRQINKQRDILFTTVNIFTTLLSLLCNSNN